MHREVYLYVLGSVKVETTTAKNRVAPIKHHLSIAAERHVTICCACHSMCYFIYTDPICIHTLALLVTLQV